MAQPRIENPTSKRPRRGRPRNPAVEEDVLQATLDELAERGFSGMSIDGIAARSGVSKPSIYRRWANKAELAIAALTMLVASEEPLTGDVATDIAVQLQSAYRNLRISGGVPLIGTVLAEMERHPELLETYRAALLEPRRAAVRKLLEQAQREGHVRGDADLDEATLVLLGSIFIQNLADEPFRDNWARPVVQLVLRGLATAPV